MSNRYVTLLGGEGVGFVTNRYGKIEGEDGGIGSSIK